MIDRIPYPDPALTAALVSLWEGSVRATHHFLREEDILQLKPLVASAIQSIAELYVYRGEENITDDNRITAFMGVENGKLEMLFVAPETRGQGIGRRMTEYALRELSVRQVDVNEQNPQAAGFYEKMGFRVAGRSATDSQGNPFPILHLEYQDK